MSLQPNQYAALKADILADPTLNALPNDSDGAFAIAALYNLNAVPDYWVWRTKVGQLEYVTITTDDLTVWSWTLFINRSQAERDAWREMFADGGSVNPSLDNVRQGVADIFSGAGGANQRTHLLTVSRRKAKRIEKLFAVGSGTTVSPSKMVFEGNISFSEVLAARNS